MDGAAEKIDWFFDMCAKYNIYILLDVHAMRDSQNGYDSSGKASDIKWIDNNNFRHWEYQAARWFGDWNSESKNYDHINFFGINWGLKVHEAML